MKKYFHIIILLIFMSCKGNTEQTINNIKSQSNDTLLIHSTCAVLVPISDSKITALKKKYKNEDDFYTVADDANFYTAQALDYLKQNNVAAINLKQDEILNFENKYYISTKDIPLWDIILYEKGRKPQVVHPVDIKDGYALFTKNDTQKTTYLIPEGFYIYDSTIINFKTKNYKILVLENEKKRNASKHNSLPIVILEKQGGDYYKINENDSIVFQNDEDCPIDEYSKTSVKDNYFTIEQVSCKGFMYVQSYTTFKINEDGNILLHKYGEEYTDRSNPDKDIPAKVWTTKDFGNITFENFNIKNVH